MGSNFKLFQLQQWQLFYSLVTLVVALNQVICAELLPKEIHRSANILIVGFSFLSAFISIKMFADLVQSLDAGHTFYLFGGICGFATLFTLFLVPESSQLL